MRASTVLVSFLAALAPLASACAEPDPLAGMPPEIMPLGVSSTSDDADAVAAPAETEASLGSAPASAYLFPRSAKPRGRTYEEWAAAWWQWALAVPKDENPMLNGPCDVNQPDDVFFLAGTTGGSATRSCTIPPGKPIFFPLLNSTCLSCPELVSASYTCEMSLSEEYLHDSASSMTESGERTLTLEIDGVSVEGLEEYRAHTATYEDTSPAAVEDRVFPSCTGPIGENPCGVPVGSPRMTVGDGHWVMLRPLPVGEHQIHFTGNVDYPWGSSFGLDVTYNIVVAP
uniref:Signal peptide protein n=1 Tax=Jahnella sp. MSr9139 TaxID=1434086 RepID=A0A4Y5T0Q0_9BACT|nr:signal peptide protein [Jahnella sp. MSr9139]